VLNDNSGRHYYERAKMTSAAIRTALCHRELLAERADSAEIGRFDADSGFDARAWENANEDFSDAYGDLRTDTKARGREYIDIEPGSHTWNVRQILADPEDNRDWAIDAEVDVDASDEAGDIVLRSVSVAEIGVGR